MAEEAVGIPTQDEPHGTTVTGVDESLESVADAHDHAEGRGLPVQRIADLVITPSMVAGNAAAGWGLVPPGAVVWFRTLAEVTAAGAGWTRETNLDGRFPIGAGTTFAQTFAEATSYGTSWDHLHTGTAHDHSLSDHTHGMQNHTHDLQNHTHDLQNHTHGMQNHFHTMQNHFHGINTDGTNIFGAAGGGTNVSTSAHAHGGNTGLPSNNDTGLPSNNTSNVPSSNTSNTPSNNTSNTPSNNTSNVPSTNLSGSTTSNTANATWIPPSRAGIWARKL